MLNIVYTKQFDKDLAKIKKQKLPKSELDTVVKLLSENKQLPQKHKDHSLKGSMQDTESAIYSQIGY